MPNPSPPRLPTSLRLRSRTCLPTQDKDPPDPPAGAREPGDQSAGSQGEKEPESQGAKEPGSLPSPYSLCLGLLTIVFKGRRHEAEADAIHVRNWSLSEGPVDGCFCCAVHTVANSLRSCDLGPSIRYACQSHHPSACSMPDMWSSSFPAVPYMSSLARDRLKSRHGRLKSPSQPCMIVLGFTFSLEHSCIRTHWIACVCQFRRLKSCLRSHCIQLASRVQFLCASCPLQIPRRAQASCRRPVHPVGAVFSPGRRAAPQERPKKEPKSIQKPIKNFMSFGPVVVSIF